MLLAALATVLYVLPTAALDTLRVGIGGNVSWTGETTRDDLVSILPEYKVNRQFTEVGNVPGNLIDLTNLTGCNDACLSQDRGRCRARVASGTTGLG